MPCTTQLRSRCSNGGRHAVEHAAVDFDGAADDVQPHLLAGFLGRLAHHAVQAIGHAFELDHARAQQVVLQVARQPRLRGQFVLGGLHRPLQPALHGGHVVDRLGHHAREFLETREAVHLQRVETLRRGLGGFHARADLRFGLQFQVAQLAAQTFQVVGQVDQRALDLADVGFDACARDADLAGLVDQTVEQRTAHAHRGHRRRQRTLLLRSRHRRAGRKAAPVDARRRGSRR